MSHQDTRPSSLAFIDRSIGSLLRLQIWQWLLVAAALICLQRDGLAVPSFARQMNLQCIACHTEFPALTEQGRQFKLLGYTMSTDQTELPPLAVMLQPSF